MRVLFDTNIILHYEDNHIINNPFIELYQLILQNDCKIYYHPSSIMDILNDNDINRKKITLSKINKYIKQANPALITAEFSMLMGEKNHHDRIDNEMLFQVVNGYVDIFITEDAGIHRKARKANIGGKVYTVNDALAYFKKKFTIVIPVHPELIHTSVRELSNDYESDFFDSLRNDYPDFGRWFKKCLAENRKCYIMKTDGKLFALLIYNIEKSENHKLKNIYSDVLKMCTFKVSEDALGRKIGELFLRKMFEYCIYQGVSSLYLTAFPKHESLSYLLKKYGFFEFDTLANNEIIYLKKMIKPSIMEYDINTNYPFYNDKENSKFIVPIQHQYHDIIFKDSALREPSLFDRTVDNFNEIVGNTIDKAYISKSKTKGLKKGDLLLFYSSRKNKSIEPIGVLESIKYSSDINEIMSIVTSRTVYDRDKILEMMHPNERLTIIIFKLIYYLENPVQYTDLRKLQSTRNNIITITRLLESEYRKLKDEGIFDERYIID